MNCLDTYHINLDNVVHYNYHNYLIYSMLMTFSFYLIYFGNKIIKPTLFITGASASLFIQKSATELLISNDIIHSMDCSVYMSINALFALFLGSLMCYFYKISIFLLGSISAGSVTYLGTNMVEKYHHIADNSQFISVAVGSLVGGIVSIGYISSLSIIVTAMFGAFLAIYSFNSMIHEPLEKYIYAYLPFYILFVLHGTHIQRKRKNKNNAEPLMDVANSQSYQ